MIKTFACKETEALWRRTRNRLPADIALRAFNKLMLLNFAVDIEFLRSPPSHHLEKLSGNRDGQYSIRINQRWRLCFTWDAETGDADEVEITDYH
jgi:proteic killer suppression protein